MLVFRKGKPDVRTIFVCCLFTVFFISVTVFSVFFFDAYSKKDVTMQSGEETDPAATTQFSEDVPETAPKSTPTPTTPTEVPVEEDPVYTFDLTDDELVFETDNKLSYFSSYEEIVILGGPTGLYRLDAGDVSEDGGVYGDGYLQTYRFSLNRDRIAFLSDYADGEPGERSFTGRGTLRYYDGTAAVKISKDVCAFELSDDGTGVAYLMYSETPDVGSALYVYNTDTKESVLISSLASDGFVLSPDGNTIAYREYTDPENATKLDCTYQVIGEVPVPVKTGVTPVAITDHGDTIYYCTNGGFFVQSGDHTQTLCNDSDFEEGIIFNFDHSQVLYPNNDGLYFSKNGGIPVAFSAGTPIILGREEYYPNLNQNLNLIYDGEYYRTFSLDDDPIPTCTINKKNLCNLLIQGESNLYYFDENLKEQTLEQEVGRYGHYVGNGQGVLCEELDPKTGLTTYCYLSDFTDPDCVPLIIGDEYVWNIDNTSSGAIFYDNDIGQIFRVDPDGTETLVDTYSRLMGCEEYAGISYVYYYHMQKDRPSTLGGDLYCMEDTMDTEIDPILIDDSDWGYVYAKYPGMILSGYWRSVDEDDESSDSLFDLRRSIDGIHFSKFMTMLSVNYL